MVNDFRYQTRTSQITYRWMVVRTVFWKGNMICFILEFMSQKQNHIRVCTLQQTNMATENPRFHSIGNTSSNGPLPIAVLAYQRLVVSWHFSSLLLNHAVGWFMFFSIEESCQERVEWGCLVRACKPWSQYLKLFFLFLFPWMFLQVAVGWWL